MRYHGDAPAPTRPVDPIGEIVRKLERPLRPFVEQTDANTPTYQLLVRVAQRILDEAQRDVARGVADLEHEGA